ncbi:MAG: sigma factor, partial [Verrucomicrobiales bacterium]|nr:sigma factor [Verrucomicrobiales bacterium]
MEREVREDFLKLFLRHERAVFAYIHSMIPSRADAEDVLQEVSLTLFEKFGDFEMGTDFRAWAFRVAYFKVMQARQRYARSKLVFDDAIVAAVAAVAEEFGGEHDRRH